MAEKNAIKFVEMDVTTPIDVQCAINTLGGEPNIFYMMLGNLEDMSLNKVMTDMVPQYEAKNYLEIKNLAHSLKGSSGYIGASRLHYVCYFIQEHYVYYRYDKMLEFYPALVEAAIEFKVHSRELQAKYRSEEYKVLPEHETIEHSHLFRLQKDPATQYVYCIKQGQSLEQRIEEKKYEPRKPGEEPVKQPVKNPGQAAYESPRNQNDNSSKNDPKQPAKSLQLQQSNQQQPIASNFDQSAAQQNQMQKQQFKQDGSQMPGNNNNNFNQMTGKQFNGQKKPPTKKPMNNQNNDHCDMVENPSVQQSSCCGNECMIF